MESHEISNADIRGPLLSGIKREALLQENLEASPGKNLVLIYLESIERIYMEDHIFTGLTPNLKRFSETGLSFTNISQTPGTGWTIAGIVASQCGTPLVYIDVTSDGNDIMQSGFLGNAACLSDILNRAGYMQVYLGGASVTFGGKGNFFENHHYNEIKGYDELKSEIVDKEYKNRWGLYDDSLLEIATNEYVRLAESDSPFHLTILTLDTHGPNGVPSRSCKPFTNLKNSILDAVHCTDKLIDDFIEKISKHPSFKDTVVVLMSDHLAMRNNAYKFYPDNYNRKLLFTILNGGEKGQSSIPGTVMDTGPTILDILNVKHNAKFLAGRSLFNPRSRLSAINFSDIETIGTIKKVNSLILTKREESLCQGENLSIRVTNQGVMIGNYKIPLSINGRPVTKERFEDDLAVIAFVDIYGRIKTSSVVFAEMLPHILYTYSNERFLIIAINKKLPFGLDEASRHDDTISVLLGKFNGSVINLGEIAKAEDIRIHRSNCRDIIRKTHYPSKEKPVLPDIGENCPYDSRFSATYNKKTGDIIIPRIIISPDIMVKAVLKLNRENQFLIKDYSFIKPLKEKELIYCYASIVNETLNIPSIIINGITRSVKMQRLVNNNTLTYRVSDLELSFFH